jgi:phosphoglycolate phosphatase
MLIVFDLDGTLIDSVHDLAASASEMVTSFGGRPLDHDAVAMMVGDGAAVLVRRALGEAGLNPETPGALSRFLAIYDRRLLDHTVPYPGMRETLALLASRARFAVLTNKPLAPTTRLLDALKLSSFFDEVIGGDGPHGRKPDPTGLLALAAPHPTHPALLVGDSPIDAETAQAAGIPFVWARYGFGAARFGDVPPDTSYRIGTPAELVALVDSFAGVRTGA